MSTGQAPDGGRPVENGAAGTAASSASGAGSASRALQPYVPPPIDEPSDSVDGPMRRSRARRLAVPGGIAAMAAAVAWLAIGYTGLDHDAPAVAVAAHAPAMPEARPDWGTIATEAAAATRQQGRDLQRLAEEMRQLKSTVDAMKQGTDRRGQDMLAKLGQALDRLERIERSARDVQVTGSVGAGAAQGAAVHPASAPPATAAPGVTPASATPVPHPIQRPAAVAGARAPERPATVLNGWALRDVYNGIALIEGRRGLAEVVPGQQIAGAGRVQAIRRQGRDWVVVTDRGIITPQRW